MPLQCDRNLGPSRLPRCPILAVGGRLEQNYEQEAGQKYSTMHLLTTNPSPMPIARAKKQKGCLVDMRSILDSARLPTLLQRLLPAMAPSSPTATPVAATLASNRSLAATKTRPFSFTQGLHFRTLLQLSLDITRRDVLDKACWLLVSWTIIS
jgi:hypothetical protein